MYTFVCIVASPRTVTDLSREQKGLEENIGVLENFLDTLLEYSPTADEEADWEEEVEKLKAIILTHKDNLQLFYLEVKTAAEESRCHFLGQSARGYTAKK